MNNSGIGSETISGIGNSVICGSNIIGNHFVDTGYSIENFISSRANVIGSYVEFRVNRLGFYVEHRVDSLGGAVSTVGDSLATRIEMVGDAVSLGINVAVDLYRLASARSYQLGVDFINWLHCQSTPLTWAGVIMSGIGLFGIGGKKGFAIAVVGFAISLADLQRIIFQRMILTF